MLVYVSILRGKSVMLIYICNYFNELVDTQSQQEANNLFKLCYKAKYIVVLKLKSMQFGQSKCGENLLSMHYGTI